jgi:hypothetical protein
MTLPQRWAMVAKNNTCEICLGHNRNSQCKSTLKPGGAPPCGENFFNFQMFIQYITVFTKTGPWAGKKFRKVSAYLTPANFIF